MFEDARETEDIIKLYNFSQTRLTPQKNKAVMIFDYSKS
jgi:hypothetical protein